MLVVRRARAVRGSDLAQPRPGSRQYVRNAKTVADLDQLAAGDDDVAPFGGCGEREHHGRRVVVHDGRGLGAGEVTQDRRDVVLPGPAPTGAEVVLQVGVTAGGLAHARECLVREGRAPEV